MTDSASNLLAIVFGLGVFLVIVAVGWRSVQNRRILRLQGANGQETIIVASEGDDVTSVVTTTTADTAPPEPVHELDRNVTKRETADVADAEVPRTTTS